jgi:hypothetical protein
MIVSKPMKRTILALLTALLVSSCESTHDAARTRFHDEEPQVASTTTTTTETVYSGTAVNPPSGSYPVQLPPPPPPQTQTERRIVADERNPPAQGEANPETKSHTQATNSSTAHTTSSQNASTDLPYGKPVPGKPGYVFSPFDKNGGYVDVTGYTPGQKVKDPYTGKIFLVP